VKLRDVMLRSVPRLDVDTSLREAARAMSESGMDAVLITDADGRVVGVVSEAVLSGVLDHIAMAQERASAERAAPSAAPTPIRPRAEPLRPGPDRPPHRAVTERRRRGRSPAPIDVSRT
jgi:CBS-domain-containing membrane protein